MQRRTRVLTAVLFGFASAAGCSSQRGEPGATRQVASELDAANLAALLGFEDPSLWSSTATLVERNVSQQGQHSLGIQGGGFHFVDSVPLSTFTLENNTVSIAVQLPVEQSNPWWFGDVQIYANAPSAGVYSQYVGYQSLTGRPTGQFFTLDFTLPSSVMTALAGGFDDLVIRLALNRPFDAPGTVLFDNLVFGGVNAGTTPGAPGFALIGNIYQQGMLVTFSRVPTSGIGLGDVRSIAACEPRVLYAVENTTIDGSTSNYVKFSKDSGQSWDLAEVHLPKNTDGTIPPSFNATAPGPELACDHGMLASLDAVGTTFIAPTLATGDLSGPFSFVTDTTKVDKIQGGDGTFYGMVLDSLGNQVYVATNYATGQDPLWEGPIATVGAESVTGTGAAKTGPKSNPRMLANGLSWPRRAYALEATGTVTFNDTLLDGENLWTTLDTGGERFDTLTAAAPNVLYGLQTKGGVTELDRIEMKEVACSDNLDNDANGLTDAEDPACVGLRADQYCATHADGDYCAARYQPTSFLGQINKSTSLVTCSGGAASAITPGACNITGGDHLETEESLRQEEPAGFGHYCNIKRASDDTWDLRWTGSDPCQSLLNENPGATILRAGLYSIAGRNQVLANCSDGFVIGEADGAAIIAQVYGDVGHTANRCIFTISPTALPIFDRMFDPSDEFGNPNPFTHNNDDDPVKLQPFGYNELCDDDLTNMIFGPDLAECFVDRFGLYTGKSFREPAYDHHLYEGSPVYAVAGGIVIPNGSRSRDISTHAVPATPYQNELFVRYSVGSNPVYRETFVVYYGHVKSRLVVSGQTVKPGQILGFVGATGATSSG